MKRKLITILLATCVLITGLMTTNLSMVYAADANTTITAEKQGDVLDGFKVIKIEHNDNTDTENILFEHVKTGAKLLVMKNSSIDRGFCINFDTPAENDKGINHILEHSLLGGSEKYPSNNMVFNVMNSTYTSNINAFTSQNSTFFPVTSQSEEQLMKLTDVYLDSVYHPLIAKDKRVFEREAWRYEMDDESKPLTINGIVYNEMRGNYGNMSRVTMENDKKTIFKDTDQRYESGGEPDSIPDLTYDEFLQTYNKNYHPSNSTMVLYGDIDYEKFLKMINENYLSNYEKKDFNVERQIEPDFDSTIEADYDFPVSKESDTTNKTSIDVVYALPDLRKLGVEDYNGVLLLRNLLNDSTLQFHKALEDSKIGESYSISISHDTNQPIVTISASNADISRKHDFLNLVKDEMNKMYQNGIDKEYAKSLLSSLKYSSLIDKETSAFNNLCQASEINMMFCDPTVDLYSGLDGMESKIDNNYLEDTLNKYFINNKQVALVTTTPKAGLLEEQEAERTKKLEEIKNSMTEDEKQAVVKETKDFNEWNSQKEDQKVIDSLKAVKSKDLKEEFKDYKITESTTNAAAKVLCAQADTENIGAAQFVFDESHLSKEDLLYLDLYSYMLTSGIGTDKLSQKEVNTEKKNKSYSMKFSVTPMSDDKADTVVHPVFGAKYVSTDNDYKDAAKLCSDIILNADLDKDGAVYLNRAIDNLKARYQRMIASNPSGFGTMIANAYNNKYYRYYNYLNGLDYYKFILNVEKEASADPQAVLNRIKDIRGRAFSKKDLTVLFAGSKDTSEKFMSNLGSFSTNLQNDTHTKAVYDLPVPAKREALSCSTTVQYLALNSPLNDEEQSNLGELAVVSKLLNEKYLVPELRLKGGAYGADSSASYSGFSYSTYRDNDAGKSLNVINGSGDFLRNKCADIDDDTLDNYRIATYAALNGTTGELSGATNALLNKLQGITNDDLRTTLSQIKNMTVSDLKEYPKTLDDINSNSNYVMIASLHYIEAHKDLFDTVIPLQ